MCICTIESDSSLAHFGLIKLVICLVVIVVCNSYLFSMLSRDIRIFVFLSFLDSILYIECLAFILG